MIRNALLASVAMLAGCSRAPAIDPTTWTCSSLVQPVIDMSKENDLQVLEIDGPTPEGTPNDNEINCSGRAEWSRGNGFIYYGAHVSDGGKVMLTYRQG